MTRKLFPLFLVVSALLGSNAAALAADTAPTASSSQAGAASHAVEQYYAQLNEATYISEGKGKHPLYVFIDPNCPYCHRLYTEIQKFLPGSNVQVRWIVVGYLTATSEGKAAAILGAKDPRAALHVNETQYGPAKGGGGIQEGLASGVVAEHLKKNLELLKATGKMVVPTMVFKTKSGQIAGVPGALSGKDLKRLLADVN